MDQATKKALLHLLFKHISPSRAEKMALVAGQRTRHVVLVLENVYQVHNASAVLRTADCFGVQDVHVIADRNTFQLSTAVSTGAAKWVDVMYHQEKGADNTTECLSELKKRGFSIVATALTDSAIPLSTIPIEQPVALVMGTEETGVTEAVLRQADYTVAIPMVGFTQSFNVSVATALCLYDITQRLQKSSIQWLLSDSAQDELVLSWLEKEMPHFDYLKQHCLETLE